MLRYVVHRLLIMVPTLLAISLITFVIIQLPPGDYLSSYIAELEAQGESIQGEKIEYLRRTYGMDRPWWQQYLVWLGGLLQGDFGYSFEYDMPVSAVVGDRMLLTIIVSFATILFTWAVSFPIGVYSATHKYSVSDHALTLLGFLGLATPNFLLALLLLYFANVVFGTSIGGLMDPQYLDQPMSWAKFGSVLAHLWVPVIVIGTSGTAGMIRRLRANLLDELQKPYVVTAKAKGLPPFRALLKYPLRMSLNPFIADIGNLLASDHLRRRDRLDRHVAADHRADAAARAADPGHVPRRLVPHAAGAAHRVRGARVRPRARRARPAHPLRRRPGPMSVRHYVNPEPFDPAEVERLTPEQERFYTASQWQLMWWKFRRHRLAVIAAWFLLFNYGSIFISEWIAPYNLHTRHPDFIHFPPQAVHLFHEGRLVGPFVYGFDFKLNLENLKREYTVNLEKVQPLRFFCRGDEYKFWGLIPMDFHFVCPAEDGTLFLLGTDRLGRDMFSRITHGARVSLTVGLFGITVSFVLGILLGGVSGYYGGWIDNLVQRIIEVIRSFPELPLWMALSAALPVTWDPIWIYFGITIILGLIDWTGLARAVRSKILALREEEFATAAVLMGARPRRVILRHLVPSFMSHLIASATLSIPAMILGETALSFLGLGLRPPITSWGVLLVEAQNINVVALYPWLMLPVVPVILVVLAFNFFGDGLRDAADPYT